MDVSKLRSDRVNESKVGDNKSTTATSKNKGVSKSVPSDVLADLGSTSSATGSEKVKWSENATLAAEGVELAKQAPDTRAEKIQALKAQIQAGQYKMDPQKIAEKMIQTSLEEELLSRKG